MLLRPLERLLVSVLFYVAFLRLSDVLDSVIVIHRDKGLGNIVDVRLGDIVDHVFLFIIIVSTTMVLTRIVDFIYFIQKERAHNNHNTERQQLLPLVKEMVKLLIWTTSFFWLLGSVFHVNIPALITGLGIGGIAIALAAKESVENFFAALTLLSDRPFKVGDRIRTGNYEGVVERIGFRSSRLRGKDGSAFIIPNQKLVSDSLENLTDRDTSGVHLDLNIRYGLPQEKLKAMIDELRDMITKTTHVQEPIELVLGSFAENSFTLAITYHLPYPMENGQSDRKIKQDISLRAYEIAYRYTGGNVTKVETSVQQENKPADQPEEETEKKKDDDLGGIL
jgi:MscS family membrane protein